MPISIMLKASWACLLIDFWPAAYASSLIWCRRLIQKRYCYGKKPVRHCSPRADSTKSLLLWLTIPKQLFQDTSDNSKRFLLASLIYSSTEGSRCAIVSSLVDLSRSLLSGLSALPRSRASLRVKWRVKSLIWYSLSLQTWVDAALAKNKVKLSCWAPEMTGQSLVQCSVMSETRNGRLFYKVPLIVCAMSIP
jgi:hypothetical protein